MIGLIRAALIASALAAELYAGLVLGDPGCTCRPDTTPSERPA